jgi:hypothetical protein
LQISDAPWLSLAHTTGISNTDTGAASRSISVAKLVIAFFKLQHHLNNSGIDFGGGTGLLTRLLRDSGFKVTSFDPYSSQFFSSGFQATLQDLKKEKTFLLAIECIEHLENPFEIFQDVLSNKQFFMFTTETNSTPSQSPNSINPWRYFSPKEGQHISFASSMGLQFFRERLGFDHYVKINELHIFSRQKISRRIKFISNTPYIWSIFTIIAVRNARKSSLTIPNSNALINFKL